jgi:hypothetical protein
MAHYIARVLDDRRLELPHGALSLIKPGQEVEIELDQFAVRHELTTSASALVMLREVEELTMSMPETDPSQTDRLVREARAGAMYGIKSSE